MGSVISGLGSGIDMSAVVSSLMQVERAPEAAMNTAKLASLAAQSAWAGLSTNLSSLQTAAAALDSPSNAASSTATSSDLTILTATATSGAQLGALGVTVDHLATSQLLSSGAVSSPGMLVGAGQAVFTAGLGRLGASGATVTSTTTDGAHTIEVQQASSAATVLGSTPPALTLGATDLSVTLADGSTHSVTLASSYATADDLVTDLSSQLSGVADVHLVAGELQLSSRDEGSQATLTLGGGALSSLGLSSTTAQGRDAQVSLDGATATTVTHLDGSTAIDLGSGVTLTSEGHLGLGRASLEVVRTTDTSTLADLAAALNTSGSPMSASLVNTGDGSATPYRLVMSAVNSGTAGEVSIDSSGINILQPDQLTSVVGAADAQLEVGGATVTRSSNTITDLIPGVTLNLLKATPLGGPPTTVSVTRDPATTATKVQALVDALNGVLTGVKTQTAYDSTANKGGPLSGEGGARSISDSILDLVLNATGTGSSVKALSQLGIQTTRDGTLTFDSTVLTAAVQKDPDGTAGLLGSFSKSVEDYAKQATGLDGLVTTSQASAGVAAKTRQDQIDAFEVRMSAMQTAYQAKFAALDTLLGNLKSQQSALTSALGTLGTG
jgi:flagellar hook-associated protein 2